MLVPIVFTIWLISACSDHSTHFKMAPKTPPYDWFFVTDYHPCYLKIERTRRSSFRVNCFQINGDLYTHSNRFADINQWFSEQFGLESAWSYFVQNQPSVVVSIDGEVYAMTVEKVIDETRRLTILKGRNYVLVPDSIQVFRLMPRD